MNLITRYAHFQTNGSAGAGSYNDALTINVVSGPFDLRLKSITIGCYSYDNVTDQAINGLNRMIIPLDSKFDNPGFTSTDVGRDIMCRIGELSTVEMDVLISSLTALSFVYTLNFTTVTANVISTRATIILKYVCPEDYLSIDGFAAKLS